MAFHFNWVKSKPRLTFFQLHRGNITSLGNKQQKQLCGNWAKCEHDDMVGNKKRTDVTATVYIGREKLPLVKKMHYYRLRKNM